MAGRYQFDTHPTGIGLKYDITQCKSTLFILTNSIKTKKLKFHITQYKSSTLMFVTQWMLVLHFQWYSKAFDLTVCHSISMLVLYF